MPVSAQRFVRKMRGGAQAHLLQGDDGRYYVVKFRNNPQHSRILVNEWLSAHFLRYLGLACPEVAVVEVTAEFLAANPEVGIQLGSRLQPPEPGWHFGSLFPGDPDKVAVFDFIPDKLLEQVENIDHFLGALVADVWLANSDSRQAVFLRARLQQYVPALRSSPLRMGFVALLIDQGYVFNGPHWEFPETPYQSLYFRTQVYRTVRGWSSFEPWLERVVHFPEAVVDEALKRMPPEWCGEDQDTLELMLERLMTRRKKAPQMIEACREHRIRPFPLWSE